MNKNFWRLMAALIITSITLAACGGIDPNQVICKRNPAAVAANDPVCRQNIDGGINNDEQRVAAVIVGPQQKAIYFGYVEDARPIILDTIGAHPYPQSQSVLLPLQVQDFRTDGNPDGDFCAGQKPRCIAPLGNVTLEYNSVDGQVRTISGVTINLQGSLRFIVDNNTAGIWLTLDRSRSEEDFWYKFWDAVRIPKIISITSSGVDPIADQWGEKTNQAIAAVLTARAANWQFTPLLDLTDDMIQVKSAEAPVLPGSITGGNIDAQATQRAVELEDAVAFATQKAVICQEMADETACAWQMQTFRGEGNPQVIVQPPDPIPAAETTPTP